MKKRWIAISSILILACFFIAFIKLGEHNAIKETKKTNAFDSNEQREARSRLVDQINAHMIRGSNATLPGSAGALARKGMPQTPHFRGLEIEKMKEETVEQVAVDLGNFSTQIASGISNDIYAPSQTGKWADLLPNNMNVLRLIDEGRQNPLRVATAVNQELAKALAEYAEVGRQSDQQRLAMARGDMTGAVTAIDGGSYATEHKYAEPVAEFERLNFMIYGSYYVLANIDQLPDPAVTAAWLSLKPDMPDRLYFNPGMNAWILSQYANSPPKQDSPDYAELRAILEPVGYAHEIMPESKWDANWSVSDPMLTMGQVNTSDIPTIQVLKINGEIHTGGDGGFFNAKSENAYKAAVSKFKAINHLK